MSEQSEFEKGMKAILDSEDSHPEDRKIVPNTHKPEAKTVKDNMNFGKDKKYPTWLTFVVRAAAAVAFILFLMKYAANIAYR